MKGEKEMDKYLLSMPHKLKRILTEKAKPDGYTLNGLILQILWEWVKKES